MAMDGFTCVLEHRQDPLGQLARQVALGTAGEGLGARRGVGVHDDEAAVAVVGPVEAGPYQPGHARLGDHHRQAVVLADGVAGGGVGHRLEVDVVGVGAVARAR